MHGSNHQPRGNSTRNCWSANEGSDGEALSSDRDDYEFVESIGGGGQARVDIWREKKTGVVVVAKIFVNPNPQDSEKISGEAAFLTAFDHPGLVRG